jgi:V-type H+-transporting ATPase subunit C
VVALDTDIKAAYGSYQNIKTSLVNVQRKTSGNLTTRSLAPLLSKDDFVPESEYLETLLVVVPKQLQKEWIKSYESLAPFVVPRSSRNIYEDAEYVLYNVTLFKKHAAEFVSKARAHKFTPREFTWSENAAQLDEQEARDVEKQERQLFNEVIRLARTGYSDLFAAWIHVKALRVFVESVLRYGLPLEFVSAVVCTQGEKQAKKVKSQLDGEFGYLGGNAFGRDKKGNIKDDVGEVAAGVHGLQLDYSAYCYFDFEVL